jgi:ubiquinone/menaquinone biosynthesis C-methylase UbiE
MMATELLLPAQSDYPDEIFNADLPPEARVGCAWAYFKTNALTRYLFRRRVEITFGLLPDRSWDRALDAGTGAGFILPTLAHMAREVDGVDLSPVLKYAQVMLDKRGIHNVRLQQADVLHLPFEARSFDLIVCLSVIEHIPDPAAAFTEMARVLRPGGIAIFGYPLEHALLRGFENLIRLEKRFYHLIRRDPKQIKGQFHPHVSRFERIERGYQNILREDSRRNLSLFGVPLYRLVRLSSLAKQE